jgi:MOSC domain-containing protein YiiM
LADRVRHPQKLIGINTRKIRKKVEISEAVEEGDQANLPHGAGKHRNIASPHGKPANREGIIPRANNK